MKKLSYIVIPLVLLFLLASVLVDWGALKARYSLYMSGKSEFTAEALSDALENGRGEEALLYIQAGSLDEAGIAEVEELLLQSLREGTYGVAEALLPELEVMDQAGRERCVRTMVKERVFAGSQWLVNHGFPREIAMDNGQSPVDWSISNKSEDITSQLLLQKFPLSSPEGGVGTLEQAIHNGATAGLVTELINYGASPNALSSNGVPLIHEAISHGNADVLRAMVVPDTDVNVQDSTGNPALQRAVATGDVDKVRVLAEAGADLKYINPSGGNYLHSSLLAGDHGAVVGYLISQELNPQQKNTLGFNVLEEACRLQLEDSARASIAGGASVSEGFFMNNYTAGKEPELAMLFKLGLYSPNQILANGDTLLIDSVKKKRYLMMSFLVAQGAAVDLKGRDLEPPLGYAVAIQDVKSAELLLSKGAEVQFTFQDTPAERFLEVVDTKGVIKWFMQNDSRITPIMMACDQGNLELAKLLMKYGAKESSTKKNRFWAGNFAARRSQSDLVQLMLGVEPGNRDRTVLVDLSSQRATVYDKDKNTVMSFRISSGKKGKETKRGTFVVTNKKRHHVSSIYDTDMPYFQRLSYGDFGFHTGVVPGYPASSGCIRCPNSYAYKLFNYLKVGDVVTIQR